MHMSLLHSAQLWVTDTLKIMSECEHESPKSLNELPPFVIWTQSAIFQAHIQI